MIDRFLFSFSFFFQTGRHKRNATFPGSKATTIISTQQQHQQHQQSTAPNSPCLSKGNFVYVFFSVLSYLYSRRTKDDNTHCSFLLLLGINRCFDPAVPDTAHGSAAFPQPHRVAGAKWRTAAAAQRSRTAEFQLIAGQGHQRPEREY